MGAVARDSSNSLSHTVAPANDGPYRASFPIDIFRRAVRLLRDANVGRDDGIPPVQARYQDAIDTSGALFRGRSTPYSDRLETDRLETDRLETVESRDVNRKPVELFMGCRYNHTLPTQVDRIVQLLAVAGCPAHIARTEQCCGGPLFWTGQTGAFEVQVGRNVARLEQSSVTEVVTACPGCAMTFREDYPGVYRKQTGRDFPLTVKYLHSVLRQRLAGKLNHTVDLTVTCHDPCHLTRGLTLQQETRDLLRAVPGIIITEMERSTECCGGMILGSDRHLALRIAGDKARAIINTGADAVVTSCPTCRETIRLALARENTTMPVYLLEDILFFSVFGGEYS